MAIAIQTRQWLAGVLLGGATGMALLTSPAAFADSADPAPDPTAPVAVASAPVVTPPDGVPHLPSPDNLPPGATQEAAPEHRTLGYLRDIWQAVKSKDVTMSDALLLIAQRPMDTP